MIRHQNSKPNYPMQPPRERGTWRAMALAILIHGLLLALLLHGINWQNSAPAGAEAELWTPDQTTSLQPPAAPPTPAPVVTPPAPDAAEIALQQAKQREAAQQQTEAASRARQKKLQQEAEQRLQQQRAEQAKLAQQAKLEQQTKLEQQAQLEQQKIQQQTKIAEKKTTEEALKIQQAKEQAKEKLDRARAAHLAALKGMANNSVNRDGLAATGPGVGSGGNGSAGYADKVRRKVLPNIVFGGSTQDNPETVVTVGCAPDGTVLDAHLTRSSGNSAWDDAVVRAVQKSSPMPRDTNGSAPRTFTITFKLKP
jgi:colicin import membrane protein